MELILASSVSLTVGFSIRYAVRAVISHRRRRTLYDKASLARRTMR